MGDWAEVEFGIRTLPPHAYLFAGTSSRQKVDAVVNSFRGQLLHRHDVYERYLVSGVKEGAAIAFQLYGAPIVCDLVTVLKDGKVEEAVFLGYACGIRDDMRIGDCVVPTRVQTLDGVTAKLGADRCVSPDPDMAKMISVALSRRQIPFRTGKSVSVPATFWHGDETQIDMDCIALELEFAAFCYCAQAVDIKAGGVLVVSDTREKGLLDERPPCDRTMLDAFRAIKEQWEQ